MSPIVDIHCHTFNADDLPIRGFVQKVAFHDSELAEGLAALVDRITQTAAPGYRAEKRRLDAMLAPTGLEAEVAPLTKEQLELEVELAINELELADPSLLREVGKTMSAPITQKIDGQDALIGVDDWRDGAKRAIRWAILFGKQRIDLTVALQSVFEDEVALFTPLLVDLGMGLDDTAKTTVLQQVELHEKISRLSMNGRLPGGYRGHVHGFVGFDPRRELQAREAGELESPLEIVKRAIELYGFVGLKMYPPMGFKPLGNHEEPSVPGGAEVDAILRELYRWAVENDVPITAHCNSSNYADKAFRDFASPDNWARALDEFSGLRLNLGHFGGARENEGVNGWPWKAARLMAAHPHVYADVGNHKIYDEKITSSYFDMLDAMFANPVTSVVADRLMFGSDWFMLAIHKEHEEFLDQYREAYRSRFGAVKTGSFLGGNALAFLGFDSVSNGNNRRLRQRYEAFAPSRVPDWLATK